MLLAALSYALGLITTRQRFEDTPPLTVSVGNFLAAGVLLLPFALAALAAAFVLVPTALALVLNFRLKRLGPTRLSVAMLVGFVIVLLSVALVTDVGLELPRKLRERRV